MKTRARSPWWGGPLVRGRPPARPLARSPLRVTPVTFPISPSLPNMTAAHIIHPGEVTQLLHAWRDGDEQALHQLVPLVYAELKRLARQYMRRERAGHSLQTTALVHEAYTRLVDTSRVHWRDHHHFFAVCATLMRRVLVDHARSRAYLKRGGDCRLVSLEDAAEPGCLPELDLLALDEALSRLAAFDPRKSRVVELRFFGGLTVEEAAALLHTSPETVMRDWKMAKAWLLRELDTAPASNRSVPPRVDDAR
jgi:RNA polymerase sigma factor (TIGR02999 family)